ncbi:antibiotic biosynthesis monooxygenase [Phycicoccus sp. CMS6Z-2]|nr:antibiotic biosynthesis monooxygenase [Phycicoccus flavus]
MVVIAGHYRVDAEQRDEVVAAFADMVTRARDADGCIHVAITADSVDPERIDNVEVWRDAGALEAWRARADAPDPGVAMRDLTMARYDAVDGGPLFP